MNEQNYTPPEKGTPEYHIKMLRKLTRWLSLNPKNNPVVKDEVDALRWAMDQIELNKD